MKRFMLRAATLTGSLTRFSVKTGPGLAGAGAVAVGTGLIYLPAGVITAGLFLLVLDRNSR